METIEIFGWIALGFVPMYVALEVGTRKLARRMTERLFLKSESGRG